MKTIFTITGVILLLGLAGLLFMGDADVEYEEKLRFACDGGEAFTLSYIGEDNSTAVLYLPDIDTPLALSRARSASGTKYATEDESIIFWEQQGEATVSRDDTVIAEGCVVDSGLLVPQQ